MIKCSLVVLDVLAFHFIHGGKERGQCSLCFSNWYENKWDNNILYNFGQTYHTAHLLFQDASTVCSWWMGFPRSDTQDEASSFHSSTRDRGKLLERKKTAAVFYMHISACNLLLWRKHKVDQPASGNLNRNRRFLLTLPSRKHKDFTFICRSHCLMTWKKFQNKLNCHFLTSRDAIFLLNVSLFSQTWCLKCGCLPKSNH